MSVTKIVSPGVYYAVCHKELGYVISYPQGRMGDQTPHLIFNQESEASEALQQAKKWYSADLKLVKMNVSCEDI